MLQTDIERRFFYAMPEHAPAYDQTIGWVAPLYSVLHDAILRLVAEAMRRQSPYYVLDIGCGTGAESISLLKRHRNVHVVALDLSGAMLEVFQRNLRAQRVSATRVRSIEADFLADSSSAAYLRSLLPPNRRRKGFDAVLSAFTFHHFTKGDKQKAYRRAYDCLAPGGILLNGDLFNYESESPLMTRFALDFDLWWIRHHFRKAAKQATKQSLRLHYQKLEKDWSRHYFVDNTCHSVSSQIQWLKGIGFRQVANPFRYFQMGLLWALR